MKAHVEEMKAKVVEAEAMVPTAIAEALKNGNIGVLDYYNLEKTKGDISLKESLSNMNFEVGVRGTDKNNK